MTGGDARWDTERHDGESNVTPSPNGYEMSSGALLGVLGDTEEGGWYLKGADDELDAKGDPGCGLHAIASAKKSFTGTRGRGKSVFSGLGGANASALDTLCACGRPVSGALGRGDAPSAEEIPLGIERVLRRRFAGGDREASNTVLGMAMGPTPADLNTPVGRNVCTDIRERRLWDSALPLVLPGLRTGWDGGEEEVDATCWVTVRSSASCPDAAGAIALRCLMTQRRARKHISRDAWTSEWRRGNNRGGGGAYPSLYICLPCWFTNAVIT